MNLSEHITTEPIIAMSITMKIESFYQDEDFHLFKIPTQMIVVQMRICQNSIMKSALVLELFSR